MTQKTASVILGLFLLLTVAGGLWQAQFDLSELELLLRNYRGTGAVLYVLFLAGSVVLLPLSSLPLLPIAARIFGVWMTTGLSVCGWWVGALIAFQIARRGRPLLEKFVSLKTVDDMEKKIPPNLDFAGIVILRMILPVDVTSYALGLLKHLSFRTYAIASLLGMIPFALLWSIAGGQLAQGRFWTAGLFFLLLVILIFCVRLYWEKRR